MNNGNKTVVIIIFVIFIIIFGIFLTSFFTIGGMVFKVATSSINDSNSGINDFAVNVPNLNINTENIPQILLIVGGVIFLLYIIGTYNKLVNLKQKVKQSVSGIDIYLKQRFDLIPNIVETVKGYASYEKDVLENITQIRNSYNEIKDGNIEGLAEINNRYTKMLAVVEAYPELKSNESFLKLQESLSKIESQLQAARRIYNCEVTDYNIKVMSFPSNVIAGIFHFKLEKLFVIDEVQKENINLNI